jgi:NADPH:quinone reductase-like Zn-dependent oxidoreductase
MAVDVAEVVKKPTNVSIVEAAASSSAITARNAVLDNVNEGDRVLILGGSGGVGSAAITLAKKVAKASFVATTSSQIELCQSLGADRVINYKERNWWEMDWEVPFDKIIDTVGGGNYTDRATNPKVLKTGKQGGVFVAVTGDETKPDARTVWKAIKFMTKMPLRPLYSWFMKHRVPTYKLIMPYDFPKGRQEVLAMMDKGTLSIKLDETSPLPFNEEGVRKAFATVASGHAHGKVVVSMEEETKQ